MTQSKRILAGLASAAAAAFMLAGVASGQVPGDKRAAAVNGEAIMQSEVDAVIRLSQPPSPTPLSDAQKKDLQAGALNMLVEDMLMRQYLRKNAPAVAPAEVDKRMQDLAAQLAKDKQTLADFLKTTGQSEPQLRADISARIQWEQFINPRLTEQAVKQYYDTNKVFFDKVAVQASHVLLKVAPNATQQDRQIVFDRIQAIRQEILGGKIAFADAAKKYSDCPSKEHGGDIGVFPYKFSGISDPFVKAAYGMKVGDVSEVVVTEFGYHIIKVTNRSPGEASNFEKIKSEVKEVYAQEVYQYIIGEQRKVSKVEMP
jgi:parvulin-like peptidyl-prolyl isomerase